MDKKYALIVAFTITFFIFTVFSYIRSNAGQSNIEVSILTRVIDGDTIVLNDGRIIRLLNINSPEKNFHGSELGKNFLELYLNKSIGIKITGRDKYYRNLAKIYTPEYLNLEIVKNGYASKFLVENDELKEFDQAEKYAINHSIGIWKKSPYFNCFNVEVESEKEIVHFVNSCQNVKANNWVLKDESRKIYLIRNITFGNITIHTTAGNDNETDLFWNSKQAIWNNDRDSVYLFDSDEKIIAYTSYGY